MRERPESGGGFTLLDGAALVIGAALASIHTRGLISQPLSVIGWGLTWITFTGIALSAAGPFVFLVRRYGRRPPGYPRLGDWLWLILGVPWIVTAMLRPSGSKDGAAGSHAVSELYVMALWIGLAVASMIALGAVWTRWVLPPPDSRNRWEPTPWTDRLGLILAICWPLQCGFGLVVAE